MRLSVERYGINIIPESPQDEAFLEEVLGFKEFARCSVERVNFMGTNSLAWVRITREKVTKGGQS